MPSMFPNMGKKYFSVHWSALENERLFLLEKPLKFLSKITATWKNYSALQFLQIAKICHLVIAYMCSMYVILSSKIIFVAFCTGYSFWDRLRNFLHKLALFCQFISWTNWVNSGKFMDNYWISSQVMADMKKIYNDLIIINL